MSQPPAHLLVPFLTPKEVQSRFQSLGIRYSVAYWRTAMQECPLSIKRGRFIRWADLWEWWSAHPDWSPKRRKKHT